MYAMRPPKDLCKVTCKAVSNQKTRAKVKCKLTFLHSSLSPLLKKQKHESQPQGNPPNKISDLEVWLVFHHFPRWMQLLSNL